MGPCEAFINFKEKQQVALCHLLYVVLVLIIVLGLPFTKKKKVFGCLWKLEFIALNTADLFQEEWFDHFFSVGFLIAM